MDKLASHSTLAHITNVTIERHELLLPSVVTKVDAMSVSSMKAFPTVRLALQVDVPMATAIISDLRVGEECWNSSLNAWLEAVVASIHLEAVAASIQLEVAVVATSKFAGCGRPSPRHHGCWTHMRTL
jgi:hypothetical protein